MAAAGPSYLFPPFRLDPNECRLLRNGVPVPIAPKALDLLRLLVAGSGRLITKDEIVRTLWADVSVTDNALTQLVHEVRAALGDRGPSFRYVQTVARRGYRFAAAVETRSVPPPLLGASVTGGPLPASLRAGVRETSSVAAHRAFTEGRMRLERMEMAHVARAIADFERALAFDPRYALPYVGLAHARFWRFEASRPHQRRDQSELIAAIADAHRAIDLDPDLPEAHAALALMLMSANRSAEAAAAGRRAVMLEPSNWRNHCRLACATWGAERIAAWERTLELYPDFAYAYYGLAMVYVARNDLIRAEQCLRRGAPLQDRAVTSDARFPGKGLHWLLGLTRLASGDTVEARLEFDREVASARGEVYAPEFVMNAYQAHGWVSLAEGDGTGAASMFLRALEIVPDHARALVGLAAAYQQVGHRQHHADALDRADRAINELRTSDRTAEVALAVACRHILSGRRTEAAESLDQWLASTPPSFVGWTIPVEPFLATLRGDAAFVSVLNRLAVRAQ